jgi:hypothetical protein
MAAATIGVNLPGGYWAAGATVSAYLPADHQATEPRAPAITSAVEAGGVVVLSHASLIAGNRYRAIGNKPGGGTRVAVFVAA